MARFSSVLLDQAAWRAEWRQPSGTLSLYRQADACRSPSSFKRHRGNSSLAAKAHEAKIRWFAFRGP